MIETIDLSNFKYVFEENTKTQKYVMTGLKRHCYIYGKNGTGKSSLVKAIENTAKNAEKQQYLHIFTGFEKLVSEDGQLDAIALGTQNADIQPKISKVTAEITDLSHDCEERVTDGEETQFSRNEKAYILWQENLARLNGFDTNAATKMSQQINLLNRYTRASFRKDIPNATALSDDERQLLRATVEGQTKIGNHQDLFELDLKKYLDTTNDVLVQEIKATTVLSELRDSADKKNFARTGMKLHQPGDKCVFCGGVITAERWRALQESFSTVANKYEKRVSVAIESINNVTEKMNGMVLINRDSFYPKFQSDIDVLNFKIQEKTMKINHFLQSLKEALVQRQTNMWDKAVALDISVPEIKTIQDDYDKVFIKNSQYADTISEKKVQARKDLRLDLVYQQVQERRKLQLLENEVASRNRYEMEHKRLIKLQQKLVIKNQKLQEYVGQSKDETLAVEEINNLLEGLGSKAFRLQYAQNKQNRKGLYRIQSLDGTLRTVGSLSTGEKNLVAFLYFMCEINHLSKNELDKQTIVFDDPMDSNDDNAQYLMIGELLRLREKNSESQIIILTHNNNFYLQVRPNRPKYNRPGKETNQAYFRFQRVEKTRIIPITSGANDLSTIYDNLWAELRFAFENEKKSFMWNDMRRILETYNRFMYRLVTPHDIEEKVPETDKVLALALVKSLNVNSHIGYETDIDIESMNCQQLYEIFKNFFGILGASEHFDGHWNRKEDWVTQDK